MNMKKLPEKLEKVHEQIPLDICLFARKINEIISYLEPEEETKLEGTGDIPSNASFDFCKGRAISIPVADHLPEVGKTIGWEKRVDLFLDQNCLDLGIHSDWLPNELKTLIAQSCSQSLTEEKARLRKKVKNLPTWGVDIDRDVVLDLLK